MINPARHRGGFSLIELIIVLVILGVAIALTIPFTFWILERNEVRSAVNEIGTRLRYGRSQAVSQKEKVHFVLDMDKRLYWLTTSREERDQTSSIKKKSLDPLITIKYFLRGGEKINKGRATISFFPLGNSTGGYIYIVTSARTKRPLSFAIMVDPVTGRVRTEKKGK